MQRYADFAPTGFDCKGLAAERMGFEPEDTDRSDWSVVPAGRNRDSGPLSESNFATSERMLQEVNPEGVDYENHRFGHWACGWFEILIVRPGTTCEGVAKEIERCLENYPILDESDYSKREWEEAQQAWEYTDLRDRIEICSRHGVSIFAARRDEIPQGLPYYDDFYSPTN